MRNRVKCWIVFCALALLPLLSVAQTETPDARNYSGPAWSPYWVGAGIGALVCLTLLFSKKVVGASSSYATAAGLIGKAVAPKHTSRLKYYAENPPRVDWELIFIGATIIGAMLAAWHGNELTQRWVPPMWADRFGENSLWLRVIVALLGGALMALLVSLALLTAPTANAQSETNRRGDGWGADSNYGRMYNLQNVETIRGEVVKVEKATPMRGMGRGIHLSVKTKSGATIPVHLGPTWYIENQDLEIESKDQIEVTGSRVTFDGKPAIIAAEVKKGDDLLVLRDETGRPAWAGWSKDAEWRRGTGPGMRRQGMMGGGMRNPEMMQQHREMMSHWKARDAELKKKVEAMNQAEGQEKIDAVAGVINELVEERQQMFSHMQKMHETMAQQMGQEGAGASRDSHEHETEDKEQENEQR